MTKPKVELAIRDVLQKQGSDALSKLSQKKLTRFDAVFSDAAPLTQYVQAVNMVTQANRYIDRMRVNRYWQAPFLRDVVIILTWGSQTEGTMHKAWTSLLVALIALKPNYSQAQVDTMLKLNEASINLLYAFQNYQETGVTSAVKLCKKAGLNSEVCKKQLSHLSELGLIIKNIQEQNTDEETAIEKKLTNTKTLHLTSAGKHLLQRIYLLRSLASHIKIT